MRLLIIGGSDAGISAGLRALEVDPDVDVDVLVADRHPNHSICGLPFYLSGETPDWRDLAHRTAADLAGAGLALHLATRATAIDPDAHEVTAQGEDGTPTTFAYDRLVIATGARPVRPPIDGLDLPGVHVLHTMGHAFAVQRDLASARRTVVVGAGYIGVELADALAHRGLDVTVVEMAPEVLGTVDPELGQLVRAELTRAGADVRTTTTVDAVRPAGSALQVVTAHGDAIPADVVVVAGGVTPETTLGVDAGATTGAAGALDVDDTMATNLPDVFAAGDCVHTHHRLLDTTYLPLGTTAHKQGRVAGENAVGGSARFAGSLGTQVVKVVDLVVARTGLLPSEATTAGHDPETVQVRVDDHKAYYPGATPVHIRLTADRADGRLLGAQIVGHRTAEIAKRVDVLATAIFHDMDVTGLSDLDLTYTPPLSTPWDPVQTAAQAWQAAAVGAGRSRTPRSTADGRSQRDGRRRSR